MSYQRIEPSLESIPCYRHPGSTQSPSLKLDHPSTWIQSPSRQLASYLLVIPFLQPKYSRDKACEDFYASYGLSRMQYHQFWLTLDEGMKYQNICSY